jgi:5-methylcytosine-specific restriction endonuclease McrA
MTTKRPHISDKVKVSVAIGQSQFGCIMCPICHVMLYPDEPRILEHLVPHELGGSSEAENLRYVHAECARSKTNGNGATVADGDLHKIAKAKRLERARAEHEAVVLGKGNPPAYVRPRSRIQSRPFPKKVKK